MIETENTGNYKILKMIQGYSPEEVGVFNSLEDCQNEKNRLEQEVVDEENNVSYKIYEEVIYKNTQVDANGRRFDSAPTWRPLN